MPNNVYFWSHKETAQHSTERHQVFRGELYSSAKLPRKEFLNALEKFKEKNFDLLDSEKSDDLDGEKGSASKGTIKEISLPDMGDDSKLNNKLEG